MLLTALLSISPCALPPQDQKDPRSDSVLSKSEQDSLRNKLQDWFKARLATRDAEGPRREMARKKEDAAKEKFIKEWEARDKAKKTNLLAHVGDLRAIFTGCFQFDRETGSTDVRKLTPRGLMPFEGVVPKRYRPDVPTPTVLLLRGYGERGWALGNQWWGSTWKPAPEAADYLAVLPPLDAGLDLDPPLDWSKPGAEDQDMARYVAVLGAMGAANCTVHVDRERIYLDCARGSCLFGLRLAARNPQMFAGVILREPVDPGELRLESLTGLPVLLLRTDATKEACKKIAEALDKLEEGKCTVLEAKGEYPHPESAAEIVAWCAGKRRDVMRSRVVVANNYDLIKQAYWVVMGTAASLSEVSGDARPHLEVTADRAANRLTVTARNVEDFGLYLNDVLVDLDKEITVVVNGKALKPVKLDRNLRNMCDMIFESRDPGHLFPAEHTFVVPAGSDAVDKDSGDKDPVSKEAGDKDPGGKDSGGKDSGGKDSDGK